jgi:hypothetical protein
MNFLERWREGRADKWPAYMRWLIVQRDGARAASGMSASGQDPKGLEAKPASPTAESGDAQ